jgi:type I restriction enzyme, S subunit
MAKNTPEIRFKGYEGDWIEKPLDFIIDLKSGRDYKHLSTGNIPVYGTGGHMLNVDQALSYKNDAVGIGRKGTIDKPFILKAPFWTVDTLFYAVPKEKNNLEFVFDLFQNINWKQKDESTGVPSLSKVAINGISKFITIPNEQTQIGNYFQNLDHLISLHQKKYDKLVILKKAMLEKMFPKPGAKVPEIRFKGFKGEWEQKEFENEVEFFNGLTYSPLDITKESGTFVLRSSNVKNSEIVNADNVFVSPLVVNVDNVIIGDIIVVVRNGSRSLIGKHAQIKKNMPNTVIGAFMTGIRSTHSSFINTLLNTNQFNVEIEKNLGATINQITNGAFKKMKFIFPGEKEQDIIGNYFQNLDNLISLSQKQLEKLKNIKKACLEKMFV